MRIIQCIAALFLFLYITGCEPFAKSYPDISDTRMYEAQDITVSAYTGGPINVVTWNIRFGSGRLDWIIDSCGESALADFDSVEIIMQKIADTLNVLDADIVLLQEVDIESKRSGFMDQVQFLLDNTNLNYGVYASMMEVDFVFSDGLGRIKTGNAILSKYELTDGERIKLSLRTDQSDLVKYGYARRNILKAKIPSLAQNQNDVYAVNIHATAFATDNTKQKHINRYLDELSSIHTRGDIFISGGDLNSVPPNSSIDFCESDMCSGEIFHSETSDPFHKEGSYFNNFSGEPTILTPLYNLYQSAISPEFYNLSAHFTHAPSTSRNDGVLRKYDRKLDYLFTNKAWETGSGHTHQGAWKLSDHMPVSANALLGDE